MTSKMLAIVAAILLVGAFALATMAPMDLSLGEGLSRLNRGLLRSLQASARESQLAWMWNDVAVPLLQRPAWLVPAGLGLICAGGAVTFANNSSARGHRRRFPK